MAGVEQGNFDNEEFIEEVARNECVYHRNSKGFKTKTKRLTTGEKFTLIYRRRGRRSNFHNIRTAYGRYLKRLKTAPSDLDRGEIQCQEISKSVD